MTDLAPRPAAPPAQPEATPNPPSAPAHRTLGWIGVAVIVVSAVISSNVFSVRDRLFGTATPDAAAPAAGRVVGEDQGPAPAPAAPTSLRSQPWWQEVRTLDGAGTTSAPTFTVADGAVQWRVRWTCDSGRLQVRSPKQSRPLVDGACAAGGVGYGAGSGPISLQVTADGPWHLQVAQQLDTPLVEPPLPAMTAPGASKVAGGAFYDIDKTATGRVTLYRQADGGYSFRLEDFFVSPTADLELRLSGVETPKSSEEFMRSPSELVVRMDVTAGSLNYPVPAGVDPTRFRSVVVWCAPISSAYAAATLGAAR
ncbi:MAG TPA: DM13 domain-containing protein [Acidimicrobiales bacterium]|nr:DM13 domain-containing protein [Acidimicrobiales bacterium]